MFCAQASIPALLLLAFGAGLLECTIRNFLTFPALLPLEVDMGWLSRLDLSPDEDFSNGNESLGCPSAASDLGVAC
jgi:hypothetical protein